MPIQTLTGAIRRTPFIPFTHHLADGRRFTISHPETIAHGGRTAVIFVGPDQVEEIDLLLVVSLTRAEEAAETQSP
jgi:hypothetical protein